jgi:Fe-S-cluster containining protein
MLMNDEMRHIWERWQIRRHDLKKENLTVFRSWKRNINQVKSAQETLLNLHQEAFEKINCLSCAQCCKNAPPLLDDHDVQTLASYMGITKKEFKRQYTLTDVNNEVSMNKVPCMFLETDNSCKVYDIRPKACRRYPHTDEKAYFSRPEFNAAATVTCPAAFYVAEKLKQIIPEDYDI